MATQKWIGTATDIKQVTTITITGTWATSDTATVTINGNDVTVTIGTDTTTSNVATAIKEAINSDTQTGTMDHVFSPTGGGNTIPEFREVTATVASNVVTLTADVAGKPFTVTTSESTASTDGEVGTPSTTTAGTGKNHFDNADNWSTGSVPVDADDIYFDTGSVSCKYGLAQSAVTPTSITVTQGYTGQIGLPEVNTDDTSYSYAEYRDTYLQLGTSGDATDIQVSIGTGNGAGSSRIKLDTGSSQATINVRDTGLPIEQGVPSFLWKGTDSSNVLSVSKGDVGIAYYSGETATVATLRVGYTTNQQGDSEVTAGAGTTLTTIVQSGGTLTTNSAFTTATVSGGTLHHDAGTATTLYVSDGACVYRSEGTLTTCEVRNGGTLDLSRDLRARTITNLTVYSGGTYRDPADTATVTNGIDLSGCNLDDVTMEIANHKTLTLSDI